MPRIGLPSLRALEDDDVENEVLCAEEMEGMRKEGGEVAGRCSEGLKTVESIGLVVECAIARLVKDRKVF